MASSTPRSTSAKQKLSEYRRKRNFASTPEPAGDVRAKRQKRKTKVKLPMFCVQKHLASSLHYDFRLEHKGVLLSWAVPKGPSLNPADKRLAMQTEDHPLDYGEFEGVIPEGYGAGIVVLWDKGTWEPEVDDVDRAMAKGDLKFKLNGVKLKGSWVLVRTRGFSSNGPSRSWLLIKHRDEWAGDVDVIESFPQSVKTARDFAEILASDQPEIWESNRPGGGGASGKLMQQLLKRAAELRVARERTKKPSAPKRSGAKRSRSRAKARG